MNTNKIWMSVMAMVTLMFCACNEEKGTDAPIFPEQVTTHTVVVGDEVTISFTANTDWQLSSDAMWCKTGGFMDAYGKGMLHMYQPSSQVSYYSSCEKFIFQYVTIWVPGMEAGYNTVGTFINAVEWITDDEARILMQQGY